MAKNPFVADRLEALAASRREVEEEIKRLSIEIERWQAQALDADVIRRAFARITDVLGNMTEEERQELMRLLVKEIVYDGKEKTVKVAYRQIPNIAAHLADGGPGGLTGCYQSTDTLPVSDTSKNARGWLWRLVPEDYPIGIPDWFQVETARRSARRDPGPGSRPEPALSLIHISEPTRPY